MRCPSCRNEDNRNLETHDQCTILECPRCGEVWAEEGSHYVALPDDLLADHQGGLSVCAYCGIALVRGPAGATADGLPLCGRCYEKEL